MAQNPDSSFDPELLSNFISSSTSPMDPGMSVSSSLSNSKNVTPAMLPVPDMSSPSIYGLDANYYNYNTGSADHGLLASHSQEDPTHLSTTSTSYNYQSLSSNPTAYPSPAGYAPSPYAHSPVNYPSPQNPGSPASVSAGPSSPPRSSGYYCSYSSCSNRGPYQRKCDLNKHEKQHTRNHICPFAEMGCTTPAFPNEKDRRRHIAAKHEKSKDFQCMACKDLGKMTFFNRKDNMRDHERRVHGAPGSSHGR